MPARGRPLRGDGRRTLVPGSGPLTGVPPVAGFVVVVVVFLVGVLVGGPVGVVLLGLLAAGIAVLLATTWTQLRPPARLARGLILAVLVAVTVGVALR